MPTAPTKIDASFRASLTLTIPASREDYTDIVSGFQPEHLHPEGIGLALLESPLHGALYLDTIAYVHDQIENMKRGKPLTFRPEGQLYGGGWGNNDAWQKIWPVGGWFAATGEGIIATYGGGAAVVYEYDGGVNGQRQTCVRWHCTVCHEDDHGWISDEPSAREGQAKRAERHIANGHKPARPEWERDVANALTKVTGRHVDPEGLIARSCDDCKLINRLRAEGKVA